MSEQLLFLSGLTLIIGPQKTFYFFARKQKLRGTVCFIGGILLVFLKWPFIGMIVETIGFLNLFGYVFEPYVPLGPLMTSIDIQRLLPCNFDVLEATTFRRASTQLALHSRRKYSQRTCLTAQP